VQSGRSTGLEDNQMAIKAEPGSCITKGTIANTTCIGTRSNIR